MCVRVSPPLRLRRLHCSPFVDRRVARLVPRRLRCPSCIPPRMLRAHAEVACAAPRFPAPLFADLTAACTCKDPARKAAALPALAATARTWPVQPVCWRYQRAVAAIDEALLTACAAGADLDARVRAHAAMAVQALVGAAPRYLELALRKRGTLQMDAAAAGAVNAAQLPAGNEALLDSAAGACPKACGAIFALASRQDSRSQLGCFLQA